MSSCLAVLCLSSGHKPTVGSVLKKNVILCSQCAKNEYSVYVLFLNIYGKSFCCCCCSFLMSFYFSDNQVHCQTEHGYFQDLAYNSFTSLCSLIVFFIKSQSSPHYHLLVATHFALSLSLNCICLKCWVKYFTFSLLLKREMFKFAFLFLFSIQHGFSSSSHACGGLSIFCGRKSCNNC